MRRGRNSQSGNILMMVFALIFVLITLVAVMNHQQMIARQSVLRAEAELQFRVARRFTEARRLNKTTASLPSDIEITADARDVTTSGRVDLPGTFGKTLWTGLPNVLIAPNSTKTAPGSTDLSITPASNNMSLRVFGKNQYTMVESGWFGYAAYAPKGTVKLQKAFGWANPGFENDTRQTKEAYTGVPALVAGDAEVTIDELKYGMAYSRSGDVELTNTNHPGVGFEGYFPLEPYETRLQSEIQGAASSLDAIASIVDKRKFINGGVFDAIGAFAMLFGGGSFQVTLEQALRFPFIAIPAWSTDAHGVLYEISFSLPEPPDISKVDPLGSGVDDSQSKAKYDEVLAAKKEYEEAKSQLQALEDKRKTLTKKDDLDNNQKDIDRARQRVKDAEKKLADLKDELIKMETLHKDSIKNSFIAPYVPKTRQEDRLMGRKARRGQIGWSYRGLIDTVLDFFASVITGDLDGIRDAFFRPVRIVHYGRKLNVPERDKGFKFAGGNLQSTSSWTVPMGRSFKYTGDMEITGDLWVQRGATFMVTGNLDLVDPTPSSPNPMAPSGRLFLDEGATVLVGGDFSCQGSQAFGSVLVGSRPGEAHPITSALLVNGSIEIPYGVFSGAHVTDVIDWVATKSAAVGALNVVLKPYFLYLAPNMAKIRGPFYSRVCYFASYATAFKILIIPTVPVPIPIPMPVPPKKNSLVPIFKALTMVYAPQLNMTLGENLYLQADYWFFGDGVVPMFPKMDPVRCVNALASYTLPALPSIDVEKLIKDNYEMFLRDAASKLTTKIVGAIIAKIAAVALIPMGSYAVDVLVDEIMDKLDAEFDALWGSNDFIDKFTEDLIWDVQNTVKREINGLTENAIIREMSGALIYSGDFIYVGYKGGAPVAATPLVASGFFVAKDDIKINCEYTVGAIVSLEGYIEARQLLYNPYFTRVSLYVPKAEESDWVARAFNVKYGKDFDSGRAIDIQGCLPKAVTVKGWNR